MTPLVDTVNARLRPLAPVHLDISDDSHEHAGHRGNNGGGHLSALIVSTAFEGKTTVSRHRTVYSLVADLMPHELHAISLITQTPHEYQQSKTALNSGREPQS